MERTIHSGSLFDSYFLYYSSIANTLTATRSRAVSIDNRHTHAHTSWLGGDIAHKLTYAPSTNGTSITSYDGALLQPVSTLLDLSQTLYTLINRGDQTASVVGGIDFGDN